MQMSFMVLEIWLFGFQKVLEILLKELVRTLSGLQRECPKMKIRRIIGVKLGFYIRDSAG